MVDFMVSETLYHICQIFVTSLSHNSVELLPHFEGAPQNRHPGPKRA